MSGTQVVTEGEGQENETFNFNQWIISNNLTELKEKLKEHGLINTTTISTASNEFNQFISDPWVLSTKTHLLPQLFAAINQIATQQSG